jgi:mono/diheme cytochrome c family protein
MKLLVALAARLGLALTVIWIGDRCSAQTQSAPDAFAFNRDIRPILSEHCFQCHGPDAQQRQGDLRLDLYQDALQAGQSGNLAIVPGQASKSEVWARIHSQDPELVMPPPHTGKPLTPGQIERIGKWIDQGAAYQGHWAFIPPTRPSVPLADLAENYPNPIDRFLLEKLRAQGFEFSVQASKETLLRRVTLDLIGLAPTLEQIDAFLADTSEDAYAKVVDRLLSSPHYGERMAIGWLDLARYADSNGFQIDSSRQQWPWRDWVIDAFNRNMPYDQFTIEQIAGDMLPEASLSQRVASGFNRNHRLNGEGGIIAEEWRVETVIDRVETTGTTWLALTLNCCRCHDHKYDPITQKEFYSLFSYFNNVAESGTLQGESRNTDPVLSVPTPEQQHQVADYEKQIQQAQEALAQAEANIEILMEPWEIDFKKTIGSNQPTWNTLDPSSAKARSQAVLTEQPDGTLLVSGENPTFDVYEIQAPLAAGPLTGILLECFTDPSLPQQSLGRYPNGNFVLTRIEAIVTPPANASANSPGITAKITEAKADYSQKDWDISNTVQGNTGRGWAVDGPTRKETCRAMFLLDSPIEVPENSTITIRLVQETLGQHNIGRFRLATTALAKSTVAITGTQIPDSIKSTLATPRTQRSEEQRKELENYYRKAAEGPIQQALRAVEETKKKLADFKASWPTVMVMQEIPKPREAFVLVRGEYDKRGDRVDANLPKALPAMPADQPNNRLGLARWIASPENPLTARVWVNRMWEKFMGNGIVKTTENFGSQADWPSHPELLDWLAVEWTNPSVLQEVAGKTVHAWDIKGLQKLIVMSRAYQQSTSLIGKEKLYEADPENRWLGRGPRFRLSGEILRDQALQASGLLTPKIGGPSVKPYMPDGVWDETSVYGDLRNYKHDTDDRLYRRSLYTVWKRTAAPPTMLLFDAPNREICIVKRSRTNTPLQALSLLNEVTYVEAARKLAERMVHHPVTNVADKLKFGFRTVTGRNPSDLELKLLEESWNEDRAYYGANLQQAEQLTQIGESKSQVESIADLAAYTLAGNVMLNLDEVITRE